jgi:geranylgeranyl pyrophosphate synthase
VAILADAALALVRGEGLERAQRRRPDTTVEEYLTRCALKTAKLFEAACLLSSRRPELGEFGLALGIAFQIVDDCLDCAGQTVETGKIAGTDLREGIPTLPLLLAAQEDEVVREALAGGSLDGALLRVAASGAIEDARRVARNYAERALACLDGLEARDELEAIAEAVVDRTA